VFRVDQALQSFDPGVQVLEGFLEEILELREQRCRLNIGIEYVDINVAFNDLEWVVESLRVSPSNLDDLFLDDR